MPALHANGIEIHYELAGQGRPIVLIGGLGYGLWQWHRMIPLLAERFQVLAFDNRGAGLTEKPAGPYSVEMLAADTAGLMDALGCGPACVMGHSMGGFVAQELALSRPDLVDRLVLSATSFGGPNSIPVTPQALAVMMDRSGDPATVVRRGIEVACAPGFAIAHPDRVQELVAYRLTSPVPPAAYQSQLAVGLGLLSKDHCFDGRLAEIQAPTLILFGEHDSVVPRGNAELMADQIPHSTVQILPGAGHLFPIEAPGAAVDAILRWLEDPEE